MSTAAAGFFPVAFRSNAQHGLLGVEPQDCELRVIIRKSDEDGGYYIETAEAVDLTTGGSDAWYEFIGFAADSDAFEAIGQNVPDTAWFLGARTTGRWVFLDLATAIRSVTAFAIDGLGVDAR